MPRVAWIMVRVYAHTVVLCPLRPTPDLFHSSPLLSLSPCHVTSNARSSIAPNTCSNKGGGRVSVHLKNASIHPSIRIFFFFFTKRGENSSLGGSGPDRGKEGRKTRGRRRNGRSEGSTVRAVASSSSCLLMPRTSIDSLFHSSFPAR